jgi:hypothetical protein
MLSYVSRLGASHPNGARAKLHPDSQAAPLGAAPRPRGAAQRRPEPSEDYQLQRGDRRRCDAAGTSRVRAPIGGPQPP